LLKDTKRIQEAHSEYRKALGLQEKLVALLRKAPEQREDLVALGVSTATADRYWAFARAWLQREMTTVDN
jgi:hypothetical protein